jgi:uncharacterized sulfatase
MFTRRKFIENTTKAAILASIMPKDIFGKIEAKSKPNILWLSVEDMSPHLGCYGYNKSITPNIDKLASSGISFTNTFTVAGVCAPTRSSIITGMYPTTTGVHNMRSGGEGIEKTSTPNPDKSIKFFSELLRKNGYYCTNNYKEDYNLITPRAAWDESNKTAHWKNRKSTQPFFAVFNYQRTHEGSLRIDDKTHEEWVSRLTDDQRQVSETLTPPPYYPNTEKTRKYWGRYLELITRMDYWVGDHLKEIEEAGLMDDTIVMFWSDHGVAMPRAKRWIYDSGTHIPLIVHLPEKYKNLFSIDSNGINDKLISTVDFAPTVLGLCSIPKPDNMFGNSFLEKEKKHEYVLSVRDRMDERYEVIRSVRDKRYRYILNFTCHKPYYQWMVTSETSPVMQEIRRLQKEESLPESVSKFAAESKPQMELYDLQNDEYELNNLAYEEKYSSIVKRMHEALIQKMFDTNDLGLIPEPELIKLAEQYGSRYKIGQRPNFKETLQRQINVALIAGKPNNENEDYLLNSIKNSDASVRYWACVGLGNLAKKSDEIINELKNLTNDESTSVRIAAAEALIKLNIYDESIRTMKDALLGKEEWARLMSAIVLDENLNAAKELKQEIQLASEDVENKYVVRVTKHTLERI